MAENWPSAPKAADRRQALGGSGPVLAQKVTLLEAGQGFLCLCFFFFIPVTFRWAYTGHPDGNRALAQVYPTQGPQEDDSRNWRAADNVCELPAQRSALSPTLKM